MNNEFFLGDWHVNFAEGTLISTDETKRLEPKAMSVLITLAQANGQVVSREQLFQAVWTNQVVGEDVINSSIATLRKALGDDRKINCYIKTVPKKGYKLVKEVKWASESNNNSQQHSNSQQHRKTASEHQYSNFNSNSEQSKTTVSTSLKWLLIIALLCSIALLIFNSFQSTDKILDDEFSIAVLPFEILSNNSEVGYFADGLAEEVLHQLATNPKLKIMSRSASFRYRDSEKDLLTIAEELNVKYLLEGSVREHDNEYRITIQLIDARNNYHLWSRVFDNSTEKLFKIQQQVATAVSDMLNITDGTTNILSERNHPESEKAYKYFVMAQSYMKVGGVKSYKEALTLYKKAIEIYPSYALAYTGLAASYLLQYQYEHIDKDTAIEAANTALKKALEIEPELAEAYATKGLMYTYLKQYDKAESFYLKALKLHPNLRLAHHNFSFMLWLNSRFKKAVVHGEIALATAPLSGNTYFIIGDSLASLAEFDKAITHYLHCQKVLPNSVGCRAGLANLYQLMGNLEQAQVYIEQSALVAPENGFWHNNTYASFLIHQGSFKTADKILKQTSKQVPSDYFLLRTKWLAAVAQDNIAAYTDNINQLAEMFPEDMDVIKFQALTAYWQQDYKSAISLYEKALNNSPVFMLNLWDYSDGLSHAISLAVSYKKMDQQEKKQRLLMQIEQHLNSYPKKLEDVPGGLYIKAQYYSMVGNTEASTQILQQLNKNWSLKWLLEKDPFWSNFNSEE